MSTWDDLAASHDTTAIARQLIEECTQLDIAALRDDPIGTIDRYPGIKLVYAPHADAGCGSGYYRPDPPTSIYIPPYIDATRSLCCTNSHITSNATTSSGAST